MDRFFWQGTELTDIGYVILWYGQMNHHKPFFRIKKKQTIVKKMIKPKTHLVKMIFVTVGIIILRRGLVFRFYYINDFDVKSDSLFSAWDKSTFI